MHVGAPKSGTTFLQTVMWHNRETLQHHGLLYPGRQRMDHFHASEVVRDLTAAEASSPTAWDLLCEEIDAWSGTALITHEFFGAASAEQALLARERLAPAEVHVVFTARDYGRQFPAAWQEALKMRASMPLDDYVDRVLAHDISGPWGWSTQDVPAILERWGTGLDPRLVHVVTVPRPRAPKDLLWRRWCRVLQIPPESCDLDVAAGNESLGAAQAAFMLEVKAHLPEELHSNPELHRWVRGHLGHEVLVPQGGARFGLRRRHLDQLRDLAVDEVKILADRGYDVAGDLEELVPTVPETEHPNPGDVTDSEIVEVAARAAATMTAQVRSLSLERDEWRRKARAGRKSARRRPATATTGDAGTSMRTGASAATPKSEVSRKLVSLRGRLARRLAP
jgi:hypothetical protein